MESENAKPAVYLVHPDRHERGRLRGLIARSGFRVRDFPSADAFLNICPAHGQGCLVIDLGGPCANELLERLKADEADVTTIVIAEGGDVPAAVRAMRAGASAFIEKPYAHNLLIREIRRLSA